MSAVPRQVAPRILKDCIDNKVARDRILHLGLFRNHGRARHQARGRPEGRSRRRRTSRWSVPIAWGCTIPSIGLCNFPDLNVGARGDVCFISQSGTHSINFCSQAPARGIRINKAASIGNVLMIEAADFIDVMAEDPATRVIGMYVEGVRDGRRFFESLKRAAATHPVVVWKGGMTEAGARATFSHTGSLATPAAVWTAMVRQSGAVSVAGLDAMLDAVEMLARGQAGQRAADGTGRDDRRSIGRDYRHLRDGRARNPDAVGGVVRGAQELLQHHRRQLSQSARRRRHDRRRRAYRQPRAHLADSRSRPVIDAIVLEVGTGLRAQRWATHEDELTGLLDKIAEFNRASAKPFVLILHPAHVETIVVRAKQLARERGLVVFDSFERSAAAIRVAYRLLEQCARVRGHLAINAGSSRAVSSISSRRNHHGQHRERRIAVDDREGAAIGRPAHRERTARGARREHERTARRI